MTKATRRSERELFRSATDQPDRLPTVLCAQIERSFQTALDAWPRDTPTGGILIEDVAGDLFRLPPLAELDPKSQKKVWAFVD